MVKICFAGFAGITGWTAPPILAAIARSDDLSLVAGVARSTAGEELAGATGLDVEGLRSS